MKHPVSASRYGVATLILLFVRGALHTPAQIQPPKVLDQPATVLSYLPLGGAAVTGIQLRQREGKRYLFLETAAQPGFIVVNITKAKKPVVVKDVSLPTEIESGSFQLVSHGLAVVATSTSPSEPQSPRTPARDPNLHGRHRDGYRLRQRPVLLYEQ
jgi:hypothetical protein